MISRRFRSLVTSFSRTSGAASARDISFSVSIAGGQTTLRAHCTVERDAGNQSIHIGDRLALLFELSDQAGPERLHLASFIRSIKKVVSRSAIFQTLRERGWRRRCEIVLSRASR